MKIYISMPTNDDNKLKRDEAIDVLKYHFCNEDVDFCYLEGEDLQTSVLILEKAIKYIKPFFFFCHIYIRKNDCIN